jgi:hypothetical protein
VGLRVATWNLNRATWLPRRYFGTAREHAGAAWTELGELKVDVALLQEATPPPAEVAAHPEAMIPDPSDRERWRSSLPGPARWWCSAVAAWGPSLRPLPENSRVEPLAVSQKGAYAVGIIEGRTRPIVVASMHALLDYAGLADGAKPRYGNTSLHRAISDLTPVLDTSVHQMSVILGGDRGRGEPFGPVHDRLAALGLHPLAGPDGDSYLYGSAELVAGARAAEYDRTALTEAVSDHSPLVVEIDV